MLGLKSVFSLFRKADTKAELPESEQEPIISIPLPHIPSLVQYIPDLSVPKIQWGVILELQNLWAFSHVLTIFGTLSYAFTAAAAQSHALSHLSYKLSVLGSIITYLVVLYRSNPTVNEEVIEVDESKNRIAVVVDTQRISISELLKNENAQLLGYALLWWVTPQSVVKILPFFLYSLLNITTFVTTQMIPESSLAFAITPLLNYLEVPMLIGASHLDLLIFVVMLKQALSSQSGYALFIYSFIWVLRFESSEASRSSLNIVIKLLDDRVPKEDVRLYKLWKSVRWVLGLFVPLEKDESVLQSFEDGDSDF